MIKVTVIAVGKLKEKYFRDGCAEYEKRLSSFCKLNIIEIDETKCPSNPSQAEINKVIEGEGDKILSKIQKGTYVIAMCIEGNEISSNKLADMIENVSAYGDSHIVFVIGGSYGLSDRVKNISKFKLSMSPLTFPHMMARMMLLEQIYRAFMINSGSEYHK
ncbi:MAG: 23S rRNA (pseudouridine(1915)-N(3))-methyltransferase RlmH [Clostridia bacterium]|nr:23S rRNA (pseudouridine(1915)-N(3))-methyltransferase RlmH [Clostridia bacterium]